MKVLFDFLLEHELTLTITPRRYCNYDDKKFAAVVHGDPEYNEGIANVLANLTGGDAEGVNTESFLFYSGYPAVPFGSTTDLDELYTKIQTGLNKLNSYGAWVYGLHYAMKEAGEDGTNAQNVDFFKHCTAYWGNNDKS